MEMNSKALVVIMVMALATTVATAEATFGATPPTTNDGMTFV